MDLDAFALLLKQSIGLDPRALAPASIERAVRVRMAACRLRRPDAYLAGVRASATELQELIEEVVVPETWFFRDRAAFTALGRLAISGPFQSSRPLRLLSAPCSTGEEPYSMAMTLLDAGLPPERFHIDAVDISARSLARAQRGIFGRNSFRGAALEFRERHFEATSPGYRLKASAQQRVTFAHANLLRTEGFPRREGYDVIFCRNVFIYLAGPAQEKLLGLLGEWLAAAGVLFVGPAESALMTGRGFVPAGWPGAFAFHHTPRPAPAPSHARELPRPPAGATASAGADLRTEPGSGPDVAALLREARQRADQAELGEAAALCEALLVTDPEWVEALCLLGLVRDAAGETEAARDLYRRALYLDPTHAESLAHLALLNAERGEHESARLLHRRADRVDQKLQP